MSIPWALIAIFISLSTFYYFTQKSKIKRQDRRDSLNERRQELLDVLAKKKRKEQAEAEVSENDRGNSARD